MPKPSNPPNGYDAGIAVLKAYTRGDEQGRPITHDYTNPTRHYGHDYSVFEVLEDGRVWKMAGFGMVVREGDYLIVSQNDGTTTRYQIEQIKYSRNPSDLWFATARFAPRPLVEQVENTDDDTDDDQDDSERGYFS